ncbi:aminotransferase class V-fold PLP-dependent enzyme [Prochlorococcus marinus]|uniref:Cysteine lyase n=1 Tax=Prochlorococcus marinus XMU1408 TaxID=2213228 RepID=A0A318RF73_PROMR|nr:aminotransferase class V-fold PLP-dependent enzyme [Prochlorococcus marinus]MBW3041441.1 cysteine lyase [Prochlorococcus marinus str. XMU1408]PYE02603.1 cysteine lyase [Prochlorococcus marinus XMU1408]
MLPISFKGNMPALQNKHYFNYGGQGPLPTESLNAITTSWQIIQKLGPFTNDVWPYITKEIISTKNLISELCGVPPKRIAFTENVTSGCVLPLLGLPFYEGDHLLISDCEHPGIVAACKELARKKSLKIGILPVLKLCNGDDNKDETYTSVLNLIDKYIQKNTKLVVLSHLLWNTGQIMPIELISKKLKEHSSKPYLLVDAAQSFCHIPIKGVCDKADIYAFTGHKWAYGPEGLGAVAMSRRVLEESNPTLIGWKSLKAEESIYVNNNIPFHSDGRRFEIATSCVPLLSGLRTSLLMLTNEGSETDHFLKIKNLSSILWERLNAIKNIELVLKSAPPSGIISFTINGINSPEEVVNHLGQKNLWIRVLEDPKWLRACVHITTDIMEIDNLVNALSNFIADNKPA